jgi:hypothetical protein
MKERPILMSAPMVRAILEGRKTQTRRVVKPTMTTPRVAPLRMEPWLIDGEQETDDNGLPCWVGYHPDYPGEAKWFSCPYGGVGDRLWVRETWNCIDTGRRTQRQDWVRYRATDGEEMHWRPSIHMPHWASRITLEIVGVRVERLHRIGELSARAEGVDPKPVVSIARGESYMSYCEAFADLWDSINAKHGYGWDVNPFVWCIEFKVVQP